jgi:hypothetical protein
MTCIFHVVSIVSASVFAQASPQHRLAAGGGPHCDGEKYDATPLTAQIQAFSPRHKHNYHHIHRSRRGNRVRRAAAAQPPHITCGAVRCTVAALADWARRFGDSLLPPSSSGKPRSSAACASRAAHHPPRGERADCRLSHASHAIDASRSRCLTRHPMTTSFTMKAATSSEDQ